MRAARRALGSLVHGLFLLNHDEAVCAPLIVTTSSLGANDPASRDAAALATAALGQAVPRFSVDVHQQLEVDGSSSGLAIYLALLAWGAARSPVLPIFATGTLNAAAGSVGAVSRVGSKVRAALGDLGGANGLVLIPTGTELPSDIDDPRVRRVASLTEAVELCFGTKPLEPHASRFDVSERLGAIERMGDPSAALRALEALAPDVVYPDDRFRLSLARGMQLRHLGRAVEADRVHESALVDAREQLPGAAIERLEVERWNSRLDLYLDLDTVAGWFRDRLERPFQDRMTELYARGIYARALGMAGHFEEAIHARRAALPLHGRSSALAREAAHSYAELLLCHALAHDERDVEGVVAQLLDATQLSADQDRQQLYNLASMLRTALAFDKVDGAHAWVRQEADLWGAPPLPAADFLRRPGPMSGHPQVSIARVYARLWRRSGQPENAASLLKRVQPAGDLIGWLVEAGRLEWALAMGDMGDESGADAQREAALAAMRTLHANATTRYFPTADTTWTDLERAIDCIWY